MEDRMFLESVPQIKLDSLTYRDIFYDPPKKKKNSVFLETNKKAYVPIIIDYGSGITKAGWGNSPVPDLVFRSVVAKTKDSKNLETPVYVGNKLKEIDFLKLNYRSPFERNIVQHSGLLENLNDYIFHELAINDFEIKHPLLVTECFANPEYCRVNIVEQFFECYSTPSVTFGIDCLFSYYANLNENFEAYRKNTVLLISLGNSTVHVVPIIHGEIQFMDIRRINVGGATCYEIFQKNINLKFPNQKNKFSLRVLQAAYENLNFVAENYQDQLKYFKSGVNAFVNHKYTNSIEHENNKIIMEEEIKHLLSPVLLDLSAPALELIIPISAEDSKKKTEMRREQAQRLKETMVKRKEERRKQQEVELHELEAIVEKKNKDEELSTQLKEKLNSFGLDAIEDAVKRIKKLKIKLGLISKETLEEEKMSFLNIPDDQLTAEQLKQKKMQYIFKQAAETRALKKQKQKELKAEIQRLRETDPEGYIRKLYEKRKHILDKIELKKRERIEINTRNSRFNQRRMQTLAHLGSDANKDKKGAPEDTFGMNDEDWNVYRGISKDIGSDEENFEIKLNDIEIELRELDLNYVAIKRTDESLYGLNNTGDLIELAVERIKGPEAIFQPKLGGVDQSGLSEVIIQVLKNYGTEIQNSLLQNIFLTGGAALLNNLKSRLEVDLKSSTPVGTTIKIKIAKDPIFDTWKGMKIFSQKHNLQDFCISRNDYFERGSSFYKENPFSNIIKFYE